MTEITKLLNEEAKEEFEKIMYGDKNKGGLYNMLLPGTTFDDVAIECICTMLILAQNYDVNSVGKNKFFEMYVSTIDFIHREYDLQFAGSVYTRRGFLEFMKAYFPNWKKPLNNHRD